MQNSLQESILEARMADTLPQDDCFMSIYCIFLQSGFDKEIRTCTPKSKSPKEQKITLPQFSVDLRSYGRFMYHKILKR